MKFRRRMRHNGNARSGDGRGKMSEGFGGHNNAIRRLDAGE